MFYCRLRSKHTFKKNSQYTHDKRGQFYITTSCDYLVNRCKESIAAGGRQTAVDHCIVHFLAVNKVVLLSWGQNHLPEVLKNGLRISSESTIRLFRTTA